MRAEVLLGDLHVLDADPVALLDLLDELDEAGRVHHAEREEVVLVGHLQAGMQVQEVLLDVRARISALHYPVSALCSTFDMTYDTLQCLIDSLLDEDLRLALFGREDIGVRAAEPLMPHLRREDADEGHALADSRSRGPRGSAARDRRPSLGSKSPVASSIPGERSSSTHSGAVPAKKGAACGARYGCFTRPAMPSGSTVRARSRTAILSCSALQLALGPRRDRVLEDAVVEERVARPRRRAPSPTRSACATSR